MAASWQEVAPNVFVLFRLRPQKSVILPTPLFQHALPFSCSSPRIPLCTWLFMDWCKFSFMAVVESPLILISPVKPPDLLSAKGFLVAKTGCGGKLLFEKRKLSKGNSESYRACCGLIVFPLCWSPTPAAPWTAHFVSLCCLSKIKTIGGHFRLIHDD